VSRTIQRTGKGSGSGKVILLGEHVVVHGKPAIVAGLDRGVRVIIEPGRDSTTLDPRVAEALQRAITLLGIEPADLTLRISGDLPIGMGLGSSAALAVALLRALADAAGFAIGEDDVAAHAHEIEKLFHGTPSGVDSTAATHGGLLWFEAGPPPRHERVTASASLPLVVVLSRTVHATARTVGSLRDRAAAAPDVYRPVFAAVGELVRAARRAIESGARERLGELMTMNHGLLRACGVSTAELDAIVDTALDAGACGAKLTGAGGGGAVIALPADEGASLARALGAAGHECFVVHVGGASPS
jgi:hydroxymethylglutaryl-CoA reductase